VSAGNEIAVMEVSSHALAQGRVQGCTFPVTVFTNLTRDHLDYHLDMEDYFAAKAKLFSPDYRKVRRLLTLMMIWSTFSGLPVSPTGFNL